jgi:hypothetical protein
MRTGSLKRIMEGALLAGLGGGRQGDAMRLKNATLLL